MFKTMPQPIPDEFTGRRALVTGSSRGIGAAIAQRLLDGGATVVTTARTRTDTLPPGATFVAGDISTEAGARRLAEEALAQLGGLDILVNNAAAARAHLGGADTIPDAEYQDALDLNYLSAVRVTNAVLPALRESGSAAIVNLSSAAALVPPPALMHYGAAKAALISYTKSLAGELAPAGIRVNTVTPGNVLTPGADEIRQVFADAMSVPLADITAAIPLGRPGDPRDIAELVGFLLSDRAQWITGVNYVADGGDHPSIAA
jgi:NAD(P)-dependent dehydrogenase (short-subunit alcohol dehydrogenase family)